MNVPSIIFIYKDYLHLSSLKILTVIQPQVS